MAGEIATAYVAVAPKLDKFGQQTSEEIRRSMRGAARDVDRDSTFVTGRVSKRFGGMSASIGKSFKGLGLAAGSAFAAIGVAGLLKDSVSAASDLNETVSKTKVVFGPAADSVLKFTKTASTSLGQTQQQALDAASTFGIFGKTAGLQGPQLSKFSTDLTTLTADMASFSNTTPEEAITAVGAALRGESEPIRRYGVLLDDASLKAEALAKGILKPVKNQQAIAAAQLRAIIAQKAYNAAVKEFGPGSTEAQKAQVALSAAQANLSKQTQGTVGPLTTQQRVLAAQSLILKQTKDAQGDFARTSGGLANQQRILSAQFSELKVKLGTALLPAVLTVVKGINSFITGIRDSTGAGGRFGTVLRQLGGWIQNNVFPPLRAFGSYFQTTIVPVLRNVGEKVLAGLRGALQHIGDALQKNKPQIQGAFRDFQAFARVVIEKVLPVLGTAAKIILPLLGRVIGQVIGVISRMIAIIRTIDKIIITVLKAATGVFLGFVGTLLTGAAKAFGWVPKLGPKLKGAAADFNRFKNDVNKSLEGIDDEAVKVALQYSSKGVNLTAPSRVGRAGGGSIFGPGTSTSDSIPILASTGEHMLSAREVRGAGGHRAVEQMRSMWRRRAAGGPVDFDILTQIPTRAGINLLSSATARLFGASLYRKIASEGFSAGLNGVLNFVRAHVGDPYVWGGVGPRGFDCSGLVGAAINVALGRRPYQRIGSTGTMPWSMFLPGPGAFSVGWFQGNPGHTAATVNGVNIESAGGVGVRMGSRARGARSSLFTHLAHVRGFARGGQIAGDPPYDLLSPTGRHYSPDLRELFGLRDGAWQVLQDQWRYIHRGEMVVPKAPADAMRNGGPTIINNYNFPNYVGDKNDLVRTLQDLKRKGRLP